MVAVAGVEQHDVVGAAGWNAVEDRLTRSPAGVDHGKTRGRPRISEVDELSEEGRLTHTGLPDDREVPAAVVEADAE